MVRPRPASRLTFGCHLSFVRASVMSGLRTCGSSLRQRLEHRLGSVAGKLVHHSRQLKHGDFLRVSYVDRRVDF